MKVCQASQLSRADSHRAFAKDLQQPRSTGNICNEILQRKGMPLTSAPDFDKAAILAVCSAPIALLAARLVGHRCEARARHMQQTRLLVWDLLGEITADCVNSGYVISWSYD